LIVVAVRDPRADLRDIEPPLDERTVEGVMIVVARPKGA
jgi:hypothetical protein